MDVNNLIQIVTDKVMEAIDKQLSSYVLVGENLSTIKDYLTGQNARVIIGTQISDYEDSQIPLIVEVGQFTSLMRLANLLALNEAEEIVVRKMVKGDRILIKYSDQVPMNPKFQQKFQQAKRDLQQFGVEVIEEHQMAKYFPELRIKQTSNSISQKSTSGKKVLVTIETVRKAYDLGEISTSFTVESNMIVTALAKDFLREKNINLVKE